MRGGGKGGAGAGGRIAPAASRKRGRSADGLDASQFAAVLAAAWARPARVRGGLGAIKDGHSQVAAAGHAAGPVPGGAGGSPPWAAVPVSEAHSNWANCRSGPLADRAVAHSLKRQQVSDADIQTLRTGRLLVRRSDPARAISRATQLCPPAASSEMASSWESLPAATHLKVRPAQSWPAHESLTWLYFASFV